MALPEDHRRAGEIQRRISEVLLKDWDPIGVQDEPLAQSEYDAYVGGVYRVLANGGDEEQVVDCLRTIDPTGEPLESGDPRLRGVARKLLAIDLRV